MRLKRGRIAVITLLDGTAVQGRVARSWRLRTVRLTGAQLVTADGTTSVDGYLLVPHRSILLGQVID